MLPKVQGDRKALVAARRRRNPLFFPIEESKMKPNIAFVCQRYGLEVNGGAELHCRQVAEILAPYYNITVYTTCAIDYVTWKDEYQPGEETINGVRVKRFRVSRERNQIDFDRISQIALTNPKHTDAQEEEWIDAQGPYCPELIETLSREHSNYRVVFFMTYLYYLTARGLPLGFENAMLIPTVHDEPPVYLRYYAKVFAGAKAIAWNTVTEREFAEKRFPFLKKTPGVIMGLGIDGPKTKLPALPESLKGTRYIVYAGRIDESKGCGEMFRYFLQYRDRTKNGLKLVLMGKPVMPVPDDPDIISLGFVTDEMKFAVMKDSVALLLCSRFESLSMVVLESMLMGRPVLVTAHCPVLKGHCILSNAGLYYANYGEFECAINYLLSHPDQYQAMCQNGIRYVEENYRWDVIVEKYRKLIDGFDVKTEEKETYEKNCNKK